MTIHYNCRSNAHANCPPLASTETASSAEVPKRILVHTTTIAIRWSDMDMLGHVNNTVYFRYMEAARIEWLAMASQGDDGFHQGYGPVAANASCEFKIPLVYPGTVEVRLTLGDLGRSSMGSYYELLMGGRVHATGATRLVWIDFATGRPIPVPAHVRAHLGASLADDSPAAPDKDRT